MALTYEFSQDGSLVTLTVTDPWTIEEMDSFYKAERPLFDSAANYKVHTLVDIRKMRTIPRGILRRGSSPNITHRNSGLVAIVGASMFAQSMANTAFRISQFKRARFFKTMEEAHQFLQTAIDADRTSTNKVHASGQAQTGA
jgi:hypothetical protein